MELSRTGYHTGQEAASRDLVASSDGSEESFLSDSFFRVHAPARTLEFLGDLTPAQREAALSDGPTLVLAGAGTGKTKTLTAAMARRMHQGMPASRILAVTFTNKAAQEMRERVARLCDGVAPRWVGTFHATGCRLLRAMPDIAGLRDGFHICDADDSLKLLKEIAKQQGYDTTRDEIRAFQRSIENYKDWLCSPEEAEANCESVIAEMKAMRLVFSEEHMYRVLPLYRLYQQRLAESNMADFSDLIMWVTRAMERFPQTRRSVAGRWDAVLIDEYQDINNSQYRFAKALCLNHNEIFVVGDDDQSIYGFRNAHVSFIRSFEQEFPEARAVRLEENFRSTKKILRAANAIIQLDPQRLGKTLYTSNSTGSPITFVTTDNERIEAEFVVSSIGQALQQDIQPRDIAILYRTNFMSLQLERALSEARLPYVLVGDVSFWERREIKDALALLVLATRPDDRQSDLHFRRVVNTPSRGIGGKKLQAIDDIARGRCPDVSAGGLSLFQAARLLKLGKKTRERLDAFLDTIEVIGAQADTLSLHDLMERLLDETGYWEFWKSSTERDETARERLDNLKQLKHYLLEQNDLDSFLEDIALVGSRDEKDDNAVSMMTYHRAKGMEFPVVILVGWEEGTFPNTMAIEEDRLEEEARLAYVAVTRAKQHLIITSCQLRRGGNWAVPSRFIGAVPKDIVRTWHYGR